jgi:hypothetical protein
MLPVVRNFTTPVSNKQIKIYDMTVGLIADIASDATLDTNENIVMSCTNLTIDEYRELRKHEAEEICNIVIQLTYPDQFNEDGTIKTDEVDSSKKKA